MPPFPDALRNGTLPPSLSNIHKAIQDAEAASEEATNGDKKDAKAKRKREMIGRADQIYNKSKRKWEYFKSVKQKSKKSSFTKYVILVRTVWSAKGVPAEVKIDIKGALLQQALIDVNKDTQGFDFDQEKETIDRGILFHSLGGLRKLLKEEKGKPEPQEDLVYELTAGVTFIEEEYGQEMSSLNDFVGKGLITFNLLWMLFPPNVLTIGKDEFGQYFGFFVRSARVAEDDTGRVWLYLTVDHLDHDGKDLVRRIYLTLKMPTFYGTTEITSLSYYPLDLHDSPGTMKSQLLSNAKKALRFHGRCLAEHKGHGLREVEDRNNPRLIKFNSHGRVMLDPITLRETQPSNILLADEDALKVLKTNDIEDEQLMTLSPKLYGFSLGDKTWGAFAIQDVSEVVWDDNVFTSLVLEQERKDLVRDLVTTHSAADNTFDDFVRLKGKGLVGLLAGPPGVGKTMTAEAIAEVAQRPLYTISSGELGETVEDIHIRFKRILELAELWDAVVLLDEADVFLSARTDVDLTRNAIASIFLRELEYYQGILMLTTNRIKSFDSAFQSRIHFCIQYPDLDDDGRMSIWKNFLARTVKTSNVTVSIDDKGYRRLSSLILNGRQIKNAMSVAHSVAVKRGQPVTVDGIEAAIRLCQNFTFTEAENWLV